MNRICQLESDIIMDKSTKNIIEAGITPAEFSVLFADDITMEEYLSEYPSQAHRYGHLEDLAIGRGEYELADYYREKSGRPNYIDWCD